MRANEMAGRCECGRELLDRDTWQCGACARADVGGPRPASRACSVTAGTARRRGISSRRWSPGEARGPYYRSRR